MDGLLSLLIYAGLFYFMMRFGCGAHMVHGKHDHANDKNNTKDIDPVCGKEIDTNKGYGLMHEETLYRFCSRTCLDKFESSPDDFIQPKQQGESS